MKNKNSNKSEEKRQKFELKVEKVTEITAMYNGIGLSTVRGSGTNGYVTKNLSYVRPSKDKVNYKTEEDIKKAEAQISRGPNQGILDHERKRKLEVKCLELEDVLRDQGANDEEIAVKVQAYREMLLGKISIKVR